jgi:hypothetical protein
MTDKEIIEVAQKVDEVMYKLIEEYEISPLIVGSIVLARLMALTDMTQENDDFRKIMRSALATPSKPLTERTIQ